MEGLARPIPTAPARQEGLRKGGAIKLDLTSDAPAGSGNGDGLEPAARKNGSMAATVDQSSDGSGADVLKVSINGRPEAAVRQTGPAVGEPILGSEDGGEPAPAEDNPYAVAGRVEQFPVYPEDLTNDHVDGLVSAYTRNRSVLLGDDSANGLIQVEIERVNNQLTRLSELKGTIKGKEEQHGRRYWGVKESIAVGVAARELNTTNNQIDRVNRQRSKFLQRENYGDHEIDLYQATFQMEQALNAGADTLSPELRNQFFGFGLTIRSREQAQQHIDSTQANLRYRNYRTFEYGGGAISTKGKVINVARGRVELNNEKIDRDRKLTTAKGQEKSVTGARRRLKEVVTPMERELEAYREELGRISEFVQNNYSPDAELLSAKITQFNDEALHELILTRRQSEPQTDAEAYEANLLDKNIAGRERSRLDKIIPQLRSEVDNLADPVRRISRSADLARGLTLTSQLDLDPATLSPQDQFRLATVQVLLGRQVTPDLGGRRRVNVQTAAIGPAALPAEGPRPTAGVEPVSTGIEVTGAELAEVIPANEVPPEILAEQQRAWDEISGRGIDFSTFTSPVALYEHLRETQGWDSGADPNTQQGQDTIVRTRQFVSRAWDRHLGLQRQAAASMEVPAGQADKAGTEPGDVPLDGTAPTGREGVAAAPAVVAAERPPYEGPPITEVEINGVSARVLELTKQKPGILKDSREAAAVLKILVKEFGDDEARLRETMRLAQEVFDRAEPEPRRNLANLAIALAMMMGTGGVQNELEAGTKTENE